MKFNYQARTKEGDIQAGAVEAASEAAALKVLQEYGLIVTFLEKSGQEPFYQKRIKFFETIGRKDIVLFSRELATMFESEVSLIEALRSLADEAKNPNLKETILKIGEAVEGGTSLSEALSQFPKLFSPFFVNLVKSGEASGKLSEVLVYLADHLEREYALIQKLLVMTIYPAFVLATFLGVFIVMAAVVIPRLTDVLAAENQSLPLITKIVLAVSNATQKFLLPILALIIITFFSLKNFLKTEEGKRKSDEFILKIPLVGSILKMIYLTRLAENLSTLISGGLPIVKSLEIVADVVGNKVYQEIILETRDQVRKGETISASLKSRPKEVPSFFSQMVLVGERTGRLSESLMNIVGFYQQETDRGIQALLSLLEPLLIIILAGLVGFLIAAVLLPLYQMGGSGL